MAELFPELSAALTGRYRIEVTDDGEPHVLGTGGMAQVLLAFDLRHHRRVAIKVLKPELGTALGGDRFLREIEIIARLAHPNILPLHDSGSADGLLYYVMPLVDGESLRDRLNRESQLPLEDALRITREVADALGFAHAQGIIHRDIKPENILFQAGHAVVSDFGIARSLNPGDATRLTETGFALGTPTYMSPEQATGAALDGRSDIYALATVLYEMLGGHTPFEGATPGGVLANQLTGEVQPLSPVRTTVSRDLDDALRRALAPLPADRYATVKQFVDAVESAVASAERLPGRGVPRRTLGTAALGVLLVTAAALSWNAWRNRTPVGASGPVTLAVFPFRALGPEAGSLGEGVADLLAAAVDGTGGIRVADPSGLWGLLPRAEDRFRVPDLPAAIGLAHRVSAPTLVLGSLTAAAGRLDITARVYSSAGTLRATVTASAPAESLAQAVNRLALDVVGRIWQRESLPTVPVIENLATQSIDAMKAYLEAVSLERRGRFPEAEARLEQAVTLDSTFALAQMELFNVRSWNLFLNARLFTGLDDIIDRAMRYRDRLSPRNRLRVEAMQALADNNGLRAASRFEQILALDSMDVAARGMLAFTYFAHGWQIDKGLDDIIAAHDRVLAVDSGSVIARVNRVWLNLLREDPLSVSRGLTQLRDLDTTLPYIRGQLVALRALDASGPARDSVLRAAAHEAAPVVVTAFRTLRTYRPQVAERLLDELTADSMPVSNQRIGEGARIQLWFGEGRLHSNEVALATGRFEAIRPVIERYFVVATLAGAGDSALAARALARLAPEPPSDAVTARLDSTPGGMTVAWTAAAFQATVGDTVLARHWLRVLERLTPRSGLPGEQAALGADIQSRLAARRGDRTRSEAEARRAYDLWPQHSGYVLEAEPEPAIRWRFAESLRAQGQVGEAEPLYRSFCPPYSWFGFYTALSGLAVGEIEEGKRNPAAAAHYYRLAERLWERGEPAVVAPLLARVRDGLRRTGGS